MHITLAGVCCYNVISFRCCSARQDISSLQFRSSLSLLAPPSPCTPTVLLLLMVKHLNWMSTISRNTLFFRISRERGERNIWGIQISALVWMSRWLSFLSHDVELKCMAAKKHQASMRKCSVCGWQKVFILRRKVFSVQIEEIFGRASIHLAFRSERQFWTKNLYLVSVCSLPCTFCE